MASSYGGRQSDPASATLGSGGDPSVLNAASSSSSSPQDGFVGGAGVGEHSPLSAACVRELQSKDGDRRGGAAKEVARMAREFAERSNKTQLRRLLKVLGEFSFSRMNPNARCSGLFTLALTATEIHKENRALVDELADDFLQPIISNISDPNTRIRMVALDALYNTMKVMKTGVIKHFTELITVLSEHCTELDHEIKLVVEMCDRLLKDIVLMEVGSFDVVENFVRVAKERLVVEDAFGKMFHLGWIVALESRKNSSLIQYLPWIIDGIFVCLAQPNRDVQNSAKHSLRLLMATLRQRPKDVAYTEMIHLLLAHVRSKVDRVRGSALEWLAEFIKQAQGRMLPFVGHILEDTLPFHSLDEKEEGDVPKDPEELKLIRISLGQVEKDLFDLTRSALEQVEKGTKASVADEATAMDVSHLLSMLLQVLDSCPQEREGTREAALRWLCHLQKHAPTKVSQQVDQAFPSILKTLPTASDAMLLLSIQFLCEVYNFDRKRRRQHFGTFIRCLFDLYGRDEEIMKTRGNIVFRYLSALTKAEEIFPELSDLIAEKAKTDLKLARMLVEPLNVILVTAPETCEVRSKLRRMDESGVMLFERLHRSWSCSPCAVLTLCLLSGRYAYAARIVHHLSRQVVTMANLTSLDQLVRIIDSSSFAEVRMRLLDSPRKEELLYIFHAVYFLLPDGEARNALKQRIDTVPKFDGRMRHFGPQIDEKEAAETNCDALMRDFAVHLERHLEITKEERMRFLQSENLGFADLKECGRPSTTL